jgi:hypothetical protein
VPAGLLVIAVLLAFGDTRFAVVLERVVVQELPPIGISHGEANNVPEGPEVNVTTTLQFVVITPVVYVAE